MPGDIRDPFSALPIQSKIRGRRFNLAAKRSRQTGEGFIEIAEILMAQAVDGQGRLLDDFHFERGERSLHVLNAPSPAATASLAIAADIADQAEAWLASDV